MNTNDKPTPCDLETVITTQITFIDKGMELDGNFNALEFAEAVKSAAKKFFCFLPSSGELDDEQIKVQVFIHEKKKTRKE